MFIYEIVTKTYPKSILEILFYFFFSIFLYFYFFQFIRKLFGLSTFIKGRHIRYVSSLDLGFAYFHIGNKINTKLCV